MKTPKEQCIEKITNRFPVSIEMHGDDFNFEIEISMEMAGIIIEYIAKEREKYCIKN